MKLKIFRELLDYLDIIFVKKCEKGKCQKEAGWFVKQLSCLPEGRMMVCDKHFLGLSKLVEKEIK